MISSDGLDWKQFMKSTKLSSQGISLIHDKKENIIFFS